MTTITNTSASDCANPIPPAAFAPAPAAPAKGPAEGVRPGDIHAETFRLDRLAVLSAEQCRRLRDEVFALEDLWVQRDPKLPFYTLGVATYLDAAAGEEEYKARAAAVRGVLRERFGWFYDRTARALAEFLGHPCLYDEELALPGFHVFHHDPELGTTISGSIHYDLQADNNDWSDHPGADLGRQLSFTLTVRLPAAGGGMLVWDLNETVLRRLSPQERKQRMAAHRQPRLVAYSEGTLVLHSGRFLHQIARPKETGPDDERITFQGHAVYTDAGWVLYW